MTIPPPIPTATINFDYAGSRPLIDYNITLSINGNDALFFNNRYPISHCFVLPVGRIEIKARINALSSLGDTRLYLDLMPGCIYNIYLAYNNVVGTLSLHQRY